MSGPYGKLSDGRWWYDTTRIIPLWDREPLNPNGYGVDENIKEQQNMRPDSDTVATPTSPPITTTKELVLAAAAKCSDAARVLKELFPGAFEKPLKPLGTLSGELKIGRYIEVSERALGEFKGKGFWLSSSDYDWNIVIDDKGELVLVPTPKP